MATRSEWRVERTEASGEHGMVAAKTSQAAEAGAAVLARGGNAVDAAVTTAFAAGVAEPWMNGLGGGGFLVAYLAEREEAVVIEYPVIAPLSATPDMYTPAPKGTPAAYHWDAMVDDANVIGHRSVSVPGTVAGLALALEKYGTITLAEAIAPAIVLAEEGIPVTWQTSYWISRDHANLRNYPEAARIFCDEGGSPLFARSLAGIPTLRQPELAATLRTISDEGPRAFYEGEFAERAAQHLSEHGAGYTVEDFARYQAWESKPIKVAYNGADLWTVGGPSGGTTMAQSLLLLNGLDLGGREHNGAEAIHLMTEAFRIAFADRYAYLADPSQVDVPYEALLSKGYLDARREEITDRAGHLKPGSRSALGLKHHLEPTPIDRSRGGCTTHLSTSDRFGNVVSLTQTLLNGFGSRVVIPGTGVLMNNGMMWFDPIPGRPNSIAGGKIGLANMAPVVVSENGKATAAIGSSGGRRIINCNAQIVMNVVDHGLSIQDAVSAPRIDASTPELLVDVRIPESTCEELARRGHRVKAMDERLLFWEFASPACTEIKPDGGHRGGVDPLYFLASAVGVD
jgi:gamma-glutamyltranspeptidase/glutathione hydrolase